VKDSQLIVLANLLFTMQQSIAWTEEAHIYAGSGLQRCTITV
jgi:hypothetical protein